VTRTATEPAADTATRSVTLLGPQRRPTLDRVFRAVARGLDADAPVAVVTAGWQEREGDDDELRALLGRDTVNLGLHGRWLDVLERDREYAGAEREHRVVLDELEHLYLLQLDHALQAAYTVARRQDGHPRTRKSALADAMAVVDLVDRQHLTRVRDIHRAFDEAWSPPDRPRVAEHRAAVREALRSACCLVVAGGHVGVLLRLLHLFGVAPHLPSTVIAWSAGAMALTERVVLFHDRAAHRPAHAEVFDEGLGLVTDAVLLPHARRRLRVDDPARMSVLARRFAPARCVVLDDGARLDVGDGTRLPPEARVLGDDGRITALGPA
jgi:Peptidase family S51